MNEFNPTPTPELQLATEENQGCGCGGCGCGGSSSTMLDGAVNEPDPPVGGVRQAFAVSGLTCGHCVNAVTSEVEAIDGVREVEVDLVVGGASTVTVTSDDGIDRARVDRALNEAGEYRLV